MEHLGLDHEPVREAVADPLTARLRAAPKQIRERSARHGFRHVITGALALSLLVACAGTPAPSPAAEAPTAEDTAFALYGASTHPWSRRGASEADFERDARACLDASAAERRGVNPDAERELAYQAFQSCMRARSWSFPASGAEVRRIRPSETRDVEGGD